MSSSTHTDESARLTKEIDALCDNINRTTGLEVTGSDTETSPTGLLWRLSFLMDAGTDHQKVIHDCLATLATNGKIDYIAIRGDYWKGDPSLILGVVRAPSETQSPERIGKILRDRLRQTGLLSDDAFQYPPTGAENTN